MTVEDNDALAEQVRQALRLVIDPELGYNILDLGLIYFVGIQDGGIASIVMTTTTQGCPATNYLKEGARESAWSVPGIEFVDVALTYDPPWTPAMMTEDAGRHLGIGRDGPW